MLSFMRKHKAFFLFIALTFSQLGFSQIKSDLDSLRGLLENTKLDSIKVDLFNKLSYEFLYSYKDTSEIYAQHALSLSKEIDYQKGIAESLINIGNISNIEGEFQIAFDQFLNAMEIFQKINDSTGIAHVYSRLGLTHHFLNNYDKALEYNKLALSISKKINKKDVENIYNNMGLAYMMTDKIDTALFYFEKSILTATKLKNKNVVMYSYGNIANIYLSQKKYDKALEMYKKIERLSEELGDKISLSISLSNISSVYSELAEETNIKSEKTHFYKLSVENAHRALKYAEEVNSLTHMNFTYYNLAFSYKGLDNYKTAFEYAEKYINTTDSLYNIDKIKEIENLEKKYKTEQQKIKIENILKETELKEEIIIKQNQIILVGFLTFFLILILLTFVFILYRKKKNAFVLLNQKNEAIKNQRSEIASQRDNLSELAFELKKTNKTKNKFFSILAHDLKNPFQSILGFSELLKDQTSSKDFSNTVKYADYIYDTSSKTYALLENLLNWARFQSGVMKYNPNTLILSELITESIDINEVAAKTKGINISTNLDKSNTIFADRYMICTILRNLISNAVKFTKRGGEISISTESKGSTIDIFIKDTGIGIKKENLARIFKLDQSFSTYGTDKEAGTGLGLIVCKEFAEKNKGELIVKSKVDEGSTFILTIPANPETE